MQPSFDIQLGQLNGSLAKLDGICASTTVESLYLGVGKLYNVDATQFSLVYNGSVLSLSCQLPLSEVGIKHLDFVTMVDTTQPRVFWRGVELERNSGAGCCPVEQTRESHERLILNFDGPSSCCLVSFDRRSCADSFWNCTELWNVMSGTYRVQGSVIVCHWETHVQRHVRFEHYDDGDRFEPWEGEANDSGWEEMVPQASFKWWQLPCPGMGGVKDGWHELNKDLTEKILQEELQSLCEMDVSGGSLLGIPMQSCVLPDDFQQRHPVISDPLVSTVETVMDMQPSYAGIACAVIQVAGYTRQKNMFLQEFANDEVSPFVHDLKIQAALYTYCFATCKIRRRLAGEVIKAELTRLQELTATWEQALSARIRLWDFEFLEEFCGNRLCGGSETYIEEREKIRQQLFPSVHMLNLRRGEYGFEDWPFIGKPDITTVDMEHAVRNSQTIAAINRNASYEIEVSFEFNPHVHRSVDALLDIGYHADELALAGFSQVMVGEAALAHLQMGDYANHLWRLSSVEDFYYSGFVFDFAFLHENYTALELNNLGFWKPTVKRAIAAWLEGTSHRRPEFAVQHVLLCMGFGARELRCAGGSEGSRDIRNFAMLKSRDRCKKHLQRQSASGAAAPPASVSSGSSTLLAAASRQSSRADLRRHQRFDNFRRSCKRSRRAEAMHGQREYNCRAEWRRDCFCKERSLY